MTTLHLEHPITAYDTWKTAFDRFAEARDRAGVRGHRISRPVDDERFVVVDLDFDTAEQATRFLGFLRENVWAVPDASPGLAGEPHARVLQPLEVVPAGNA